jgi:hypothetical protein
MEDVRYRYGAKRARQVIDYIVFDELDTSGSDQMIDVRKAAREEVVEDNDARTIRDQAITQMRSDETGAPRHQRDFGSIVQNRLLVPQAAEALAGPMRSRRAGCELSGRRAGRKP